MNFFVLITFAPSEKRNVSSLQFAPVINCRTECVQPGRGHRLKKISYRHVLLHLDAVSSTVFITLCAKEKFCHGPGFLLCWSCWIDSSSSFKCVKCSFLCDELLVLVSISSSSFSVSLLVFPSLSSLCLCPHVRCVSSCFHVYYVFLWIVSSTRT